MYSFRVTVSSLALLGSVAVATSASAQTAETPGEGTTIRLGQSTASTSWFQSAIYEQMLEELGYDVPDPTTLDVPVGFQSAANGDMDFFTDGWFPLHNTFLDRVGDSARPVGYVVKQGALQGYLVDKASADEFDITTLDDFKREEVREAFDRNGNGKADMVACPPGWGCEVTIEHHMDAFDLRDSVDSIKANYTASMADAVAAFGQGEPILFYTWTPNWTVNELKLGEDVVWIQTPGIDLPAEQAELADTATVEGLDGCVADPCELGWPVNDIRFFGNSAFLDENPAARTLIEEASIPLEDISAQAVLMYQGEDSAEDIDRQAADWIEANREQVDAWLATARQAAAE